MEKASQMAMPVLGLTDWIVGPHVPGQVTALSVTEEGFALFLPAGLQGTAYMWLISKVLAGCCHQSMKQTCSLPHV
jgi:hypothetical protein